MRSSFNGDWQFFLCFRHTFSLDALLTNVKVDGLSAYDVNKGDFKLIGLKLIMNVSWPLIIASTNYAMEGKADNFEIYGEGEMKWVSANVSFEIDINLHRRDVKSSILRTHTRNSREFHRQSYCVSRVFANINIGRLCKLNLNFSKIVPVSIIIVILQSYTHISIL